MNSTRRPKSTLGMKNDVSLESRVGDEKRCFIKKQGVTRLTDRGTISV